MDDKPVIHKSTIRFQIAAVLNEAPKDSLLNNENWRYTPSLRFSWLNNYVDAGVVSTEGSSASWKRLKAGAPPPAAAPAPAPTPVDPKAKGKAAAPAPAPAPAPAAAAPSDAGAAGEPALLAFSHNVDLVGDLLTAAKINEHPVANVLVGLHPTVLAAAATTTAATAGGDAAAASAGKGGKSAAPAKAAAPSAGAAKGGAGGASAGPDNSSASSGGSNAPSGPPPALHFVGMVPMDCSPLLAGQSSVSLVFGDLGAAMEAAKIKKNNKATPAAGAAGSAAAGGEGAPPAGSAVTPHAAADGTGAGASGANDDDEEAAATKELESLLGAPVTMQQQQQQDTVMVLPPLPGFRFLHVSVSFAKCERPAPPPPPKDPSASPAVPASANPAGKASASAAKPAPAAAAGKGKDAAAAAAAAAAATPAAPVEMMEAVKPPMLFSPSISRLLNPLTITLHSAVDVPGISLADGVDKKLEKLLRPTPYSILKRSCLPAYALLRFYPPPSPSTLTSLGIPAAEVTPLTVPKDSVETEQCSSPSEAAARIVAVDEKGLLRLPLKQILQGPSSSPSSSPDASTGTTTPTTTASSPPLPPRLVMTPAVPQSSDLQWECTTVYCVGLHDPTLLRTWLKSRPVTVELHDRHCDAWELLQEEGAPAPAALPPPGHSLAPSLLVPKTPGGKAPNADASAATATTTGGGPASSPPAPGSAKPPSASVSKPAAPGSANVAAAAAGGAAGGASAGPGGKPGSALPAIAEGTAAAPSTGPRPIPTPRDVLVALATLNATTAAALRKQQRKQLSLMSPGGGNGNGSVASLATGLLSSPSFRPGTAQDGTGGFGFTATVGTALPQTPSRKAGASTTTTTTISSSLAPSRKDIGGQWPYLWLPLHRLEAYQGMVDGTSACPFEQFHQHAAAAAASASEAGVASTTAVPSSAGASKGAPPGSAKPAPAPATVRAPSAGLAGQVPPAAAAAAASETAAAAGEAAVKSGPPPSAAKHPLQLVDSLIIRELAFRALSSRERHPHGIASFRLDALLDRAPEHLQVLAAKRGVSVPAIVTSAAVATEDAAVATASSTAAAASSVSPGKGSPEKQKEKAPSVDRRRGTGTFAPPLSLTLSAPVQPRQRLFVPLTPEPLYALSSEQKLCREVGAYNRHDTSLKIKLVLAYPTLLHRKGPSPLIQHHLDIAAAEASAKAMAEAQAKAAAMAEAAAKAAPAAAAAAPSAGPAGKKPPSAAVGGKADPKAAAAAAAAAAPAPAPATVAPPADDPVAKAKKEQEERERKAREDRDDVTPVGNTAPFALFERVLLSFPYQDDDTLKRVLDAVEASNCAALPHASASLRSYKLTQEETEGIEKGKLDVITGVELIDTGSGSSLRAAQTAASSTGAATTVGSPAATAILGGKRARRIFILEGLSLLRNHQDPNKTKGAAARKGLAMLHALFRERGASDPQALFYLCNQQITFERRLYSSFQVFPKMIRLRKPLQTVLSDPATYHPESVSRPLFDTLNSLRELQRVDRLKTAHAFDLFPSAEGLNELQLLYGDAVSLVDAYGAANPDAYALEESIAKLDFTSKISAEQSQAALDPVRHSLEQATMTATMTMTGTFSGGGQLGEGQDEEEGEQRQHSTKKSKAVVSASHSLYNLGELASTLDASANTYDKMKATKALERLQRNVVKQNVDAADELAATKAREKPPMSAEFLALSGFVSGNGNGNGSGADGGGGGGEFSMMSTADLQSLLPGGMVFGYSGQKLNTTQWLKEQMLKRLAAQDRTATYTYSQDFASASLAVAAPGSAGAGAPASTGPAGSAPIITGSMLNEAGKLDSGKVMARTNDLSKWKTAEGFVYPPKKSPEAYVQHADKPTPFRIEECSMPFIEPAEVKALADAETRRTGDPRLTGHGDAFYRTDADPHPMKDGVFGFADNTGKPLPLKEFYSSVHLGGDGVEEELLKKKQEEYLEWKRRVLVDDVTFKAYKSSDASRTGRLGSMLGGTLPGESPTPKKLGLKLVHGATLPSGKPIPLEAPPVSLHATEQYEDKTNFVNIQSPITFKFRDIPIGKPGQDFDLHASLYPRKAKASALYSPLRAAGMSNVADAGKVPYLKTHKEGVNTDAFAVAPQSSSSSSSSLTSS